MDQSVCYAFDRGLHQDKVDRLESILSGQSVLVAGSPARLYRMMWNLYIDLYRNGWGSAYQLMPDCVSDLYRFSQQLGWHPEDAQTKAAFRALNTFYNAHMKAYNTAYGDENESLDEPVAQDDVEWPSAEHMYPHMELIMDYLVEQLSQFSDPLQPLSGRSSVA